MVSFLVNPLEVGCFSNTTRSTPLEKLTLTLSSSTVRGRVTRRYVFVEGFSGSMERVNCPTARSTTAHRANSGGSLATNDRGHRVLVGGVLLFGGLDHENAVLDLDTDVFSSHSRKIGVDYERSCGV